MRVLSGGSQPTPRRPWDSADHDLSLHCRSMTWTLVVGGWQERIESARYLTTRPQALHAEGEGGCGVGGGGGGLHREGSTATGPDDLGGAGGDRGGADRGEGTDSGAASMDGGRNRSCSSAAAGASADGGRASPIAGAGPYGRPRAHAPADEVCGGARAAAPRAELDPAEAAGRLGRADPPWKGAPAAAAKEEEEEEEPAWLEPESVPALCGVSEVSPPPPAPRPLFAADPARCRCTQSVLQSSPAPRRGLPSPPIQLLGSMITGIPRSVTIPRLHAHGVPGFENRRDALPR